MPDENLLKIENMTMRFGNQLALDDVSIGIPKGLMVGLIGPNGCGKSTMMKCVSKTYSMTSGRVHIDGRDAADMTAADISRLVAFVPAEAGFTFGMSVTDMVMLGRYPYVNRIWWETKDDEAKVKEAIAKFGLIEHRRKQVSLLSSGERQRVLIAKAYVQEPALMLVDEPTSHLDMKYKLDVMQYLRDMADSDMTVLVAEHDISLMARYCDFCIIMKKGKIVATGKPDDVITEELIRDVYEVDARVGRDADGEIYVHPKRYVKHGA